VLSQAVNAESALSQESEQFSALFAANSLASG
jgi:hypothetical protein